MHTIIHYIPTTIETHEVTSSKRTRDPDRAMASLYLALLFMACPVNTIQVNSIHTHHIKSNSKSRRHSMPEKHVSQQLKNKKPLRPIKNKQFK